MSTGLPGTVLNQHSFTGLHRRTVRSDSNPFDKATVFSIYPRPIKAEHLTTQPSTYEIPAGTDKEPATLVVGPASWWRDIDPEQPLLEIKVSSIQVADSIVNDYCKARFGCNMGDCKPGLFYLPGEISVKELQSKHPHLILNAIERQRNWYKVIVDETDAMWSVSNGSPRVVDDTARIAAQELGLQRDWLNNFKSIEMVKCVACGQLRNPDFPVCQHCHAVVDKAKAEKLGLVFAK